MRREGSSRRGVGIPIDSGIDLSITIDKLRVFINKTLSTESLINQLLTRGLAYQLLLIVGKLGQGMRSCKCTSYDLYAGGCQCQWQVCVSDAMVSVCMSRWMCVYVSFQLLSFKFNSGCLFSPHHVNQGAVQKPTPQVTLYEPHTVLPSPTLPFARFAGITTVSQSASVFLHLVFLGKKVFFPKFLCFLRIFPLVF